MIKTFKTLSAFLLTFFLLSTVDATAKELYNSSVLLRETGAPQTITDSFSAPAINGDAMLTVHNGDPDTADKRVTSAHVLLNGNEIFSPDDFKKKTYLMERVVTLEEQNTIEIQIAGAPSTFLTVSIVGDIVSPPTGDTEPLSPENEQFIYNEYGPSFVGAQVTDYLGNEIIALVHASAYSWSDLQIKSNVEIPGVSTAHFLTAGFIQITYPERYAPIYYNGENYITEIIVKRPNHKEEDRSLRVVIWNEDEESLEFATWGDIYDGSGLTFKPAISSNRHVVFAIVQY